jgi:Domain of unknown function (DUF4258)
MRPTYSYHARLRMRQRNISEAEIEETLVHDHTRYTDRKGNPIYINPVKGRRIKVVVALGSDPPHVITAGD